MIHPLIVNENYINYQDYSSERLVHGILDRKCIPGTGINTSPQYYHELSLMYKYKYEDDIIIEGCPMESSFGIQMRPKPNQQGIETTLGCKIKDLQFLAFIERMYNDLAQIIFNHKGQVQMHHFNVNHAECFFKYPIFKPRDHVTGEFLPNREPSIFLKLQTGFLNQTIFTDDLTVMIPWHELSGTYIKFIPYIHIKYIYIGHGRASLQLTLLKATVLYFGPLIKQIPHISPQPSKYHLEAPDFSDTYISYQDYNSASLFNDAIRSRWHNDTYYDVPLLYDYNGVHKEFLIEGPQMISKQGILMDDTNPFMELIMTDTKFIRDIYHDCARILASNKGPVQMYHFNENKPEASGFHSPIDNQSTIRVRLIGWSQRMNTSFIDPQGCIVLWDRLQNTTVTMIPLLHVVCLTIKGMATLDIILESAVVTEIKQN